MDFSSISQATTMAAKSACPVGAEPSRTSAAFTASVREAREWAAHTTRRVQTLMLLKRCSYLLCRPLSSRWSCPPASGRFRAAPGVLPSESSAALTGTCLCPQRLDFARSRPPQRHGNLASSRFHGPRRAWPPAAGLQSMVSQPALVGADSMSTATGTFMEHFQTLSAHLFG